jgi:phosphatidylglycerophosphatase C
MTPRTVAIFDFDHTLTSWDTGARFFRWLLLRSPWRMGLFLGVVPFIFPFFMARPARKYPVRFAVWVATLGISHDQLSCLAKSHVATVLDSGETFLLHEARARISQRHSLGHEVVIATGALEVLALEILLAEGVQDITIIGSTLRRFLNGMVVNQHCYGLKKVPMLCERGYSPPWAFVYSDHQDDLPILEQGNERYVINPRPDCATRICKALGASTTVLMWH